MVRSVYYSPTNMQEAFPTVHDDPGRLWNQTGSTYTNFGFLNTFGNEVSQPENGTQIDFTIFGFH